MYAFNLKIRFNFEILFYIYYNKSKLLYSS